MWADWRVHLYGSGWGLFTCSFHPHCPAQSHTPSHTSCRREMAVMDPSRGRCEQQLRNPLLWTMQSYFHPRLSPKLKSRPGSLSERNGLSGGLRRVRRKRRNSNIDLFGTERSTDWRNRESNHKAGSVLQPAGGRDHHSAW